ncbi:WYL domain-containing protein [Vibrio coralliirubri]|uniref:WYL domain-containing protein n=1 Tax=Vibrio coralliirubri TaxID=1516159 RepID=UPI00073EF984|nr:WYL domain-containing protein [Vibrio coralliirubri]MCY9863345.1 WYL domain-containing protein [Vibrio coralliirubri]
MTLAITPLDKNFNYSPDVLSRYRLIEILALWEGRLTTKHLCKCFDIGRQQASKDIRVYREEIAPHNLEYDKQLRGYKPTEHFEAVLTSGTVEDYLSLLAFNKRRSSKVAQFHWGFDSIAMIVPPIRNVQPSMLQAVVRAISNKQRLEIDYLSLDNPIAETRVIAPHTLVQTPLRWHVRAYCEKNKGYRDFVLSRFSGDTHQLGVTPNLIDGDEAWHMPVTIDLIANTELNLHQRDLVELDYGMQDGHLKIPTSLALVNYVLLSLGLNVLEVDVVSEQQQIAIKNLEEIRSLLLP